MELAQTAMMELAQTAMVLYHCMFGCIFVDLEYMYCPIRDMDFVCFVELNLRPGPS